MDLQEEIFTLRAHTTQRDSSQTSVSDTRLLILSVPLIRVARLPRRLTRYRSFHAGEAVKLGQRSSDELRQSSVLPPAPTQTAPHERPAARLLQQPRVLQSGYKQHLEAVLYLHVPHVDCRISSYFFIDALHVLLQQNTDDGFNSARSSLVEPPCSDSLRRRETDPETSDHR